MPKQTHPTCLASPKSLSGSRRASPASRWLAPLAVVFALLATTPAIAEEIGGPQEMLITYQSTPENRPAFREHLQREGNAQLEALKKKGVLKNYQIVFNPFVQPGTWDAMAILSFTSFEQTKHWIELERTSPGGLSAHGLALGKPTGTYSADLEWSGESAKPGDDRNHVFYVIPYSYKDAGEYKKYVDAYVIPQIKGWASEGVLSRYRLYMNRYPVGEPWDALFVYQYRDHDAFGRRGETVAKVRKPLQSVPAWKAYSDIKSTLRSETENTIAELLPAK